MQSHYVCSECGYTSKLAGMCQNDACIRQATRLSECHCEDGEHDMILKKLSPENGEDLAQQEKEAAQNGYSVNTLDLDNEPPSL